MGFGKKAAFSLTRPIYRTLFERPLWWFLAKVKAFFFAETTERLLRLESKLDQLEKLGNIEDLLRHTKASNAEQWDAIEQLLLSIFRQRDSSIRDADRDFSTQHTAVSSATEVNVVNGPNNIR